MKKVLIAAVFSLLCTVGALGQGQKGTNAQRIEPQDVYGVWPAMTSAATSTPLLIVSDASLKPGGSNPGTLLFYTPKFITVQASVTGSPATCGYHLYGTLKLPSESPVFPTDYEDLSGVLDCTAATGRMVHIYYKPVVSVIVSFTALTGGTAPSATFRVLAAH